MPYIRFPLVGVSPLFVAGAVQNNPEIRTQSIRGQLRFWYRAYLGAIETDTEEIYKLESDIFGSTSRASAVSIQVRRILSDFKRIRPVPHSSRVRFQSQAMVNTEFELRYIVPPAVPYPTQLSHATSLWILLGGIGRRSRRMMGSVQLASRPKKKSLDMSELALPAWWRNWDKLKNRPDLFPRLVAQAIELAYSDLPENSKLIDGGNAPDFPTLRRRYSRVLVAQQGYRTAEEANIAFFRVIRQNRYRADEQIFGHASNGRHASPVVAQVRYLGDAYYPIITAMRSSSLRGDWSLVDDALNQLKNDMKCEEVWGNGQLAN